MWQGKFEFQPHDAHYRGKVGNNDLHAHFAIQIVRGMDRPVSVETPLGLFTAPIVTIGSLIRHRLHQHDDVLIRWVEPSSAEGLALAARHTAPVMTTDAPSTGYREDVLDETMQRAIDQLSSVPQSLATIARDIGISPHRLRRAARATLGGSLCHWTLWLKLRRAVIAIVEGVPLAQAATDGGFSDQAHLNRTMRAMFGTTPGAFQLAAQGRIDCDTPGRGR